MPEIFLIPVINILDVHDAVIRDWLHGLDHDTVEERLRYPFMLERFFPENEKHALLNGKKIHDEIISLFDDIDPQAVFLNISTDFCEIENRYNKRRISPVEFWLEYCETISKDIHEPARTLYKIYINEIIKNIIRLVETRDRLPVTILFYGQETVSKNEFRAAYEETFNIVEEFTLHMAREANQIMNLRERPRHLWHSSMDAAQVVISYEETEKFYNELFYRIKRLLKYKAREYFVKTLKAQAIAYLNSYEKFLYHKMRQDEIKISNILEGLMIIRSQSRLSKIAILCDPMDYAFIDDFLENRMDHLSDIFVFSNKKINLLKITDKMKPFIQKNRIMQINYEIALDILGRKIPEEFRNSKAILFKNNFF